MKYLGDDLQTTLYIYLLEDTHRQDLQEAQQHARGCKTQP